MKPRRGPSLQGSGNPRIDGLSNDGGTEASPGYCKATNRRAGRADEEPVDVGEEPVRARLHRARARLRYAISSHGDRCDTSSSR